jgi:hypothetical protein
MSEPLTYGREWQSTEKCISLGRFRLVYSPNTDPFDLFDDIKLIVERSGIKTERPKGYIFFNDKRPMAEKITGWFGDGKKSYFAHLYGKPSPLLKKILASGQIGIDRRGSVEVIPWPDGRTLVVCRDDNSIFDIWACLELPEEDCFTE